MTIQRPRFLLSLNLSLILPSISKVIYLAFLIFSLDISYLALEKMSSLYSVCEVETGQYVLVLRFWIHFLEPLRVHQVHQRLLWGLQNLIIIPCDYHTNFLNPMLRTPSEIGNQSYCHEHMDRVTLPLTGF